jgi:hypothetical protein
MVDEDVDDQLVVQDVDDQLVIQDVIDQLVVKDVDDKLVVQDVDDQLVVQDVEDQLDDQLDGLGGVEERDQLVICDWFRTRTVMCSTTNQKTRRHFI